MDKGQEMAKTSAVGGFQLFLGRSVSTIILAVGTIILGLFIQESDLGLYTVALIPATTFLLFQDWGVMTALTRFCAKCKASNDEFEQRKIIVAGLVFEIATGVVLTVVCILFASFIGVSLGKPQSTLLIAVSSITILMAAIANAPSGIFTGYEQMKPITYVAISQALVQGLLTPLLVFLGYGAMGAVIGFTLASVVAATVAMVLLYTRVIRKLAKHRLLWSDIKGALKQLLHYGIPLAVGNILTGLLGQFYSFMMAYYVADAMIGNNKIASNFAIVLSLLSYPIMTVLFPAFSKLDPVKERGFLKTVYASSVKYTVIFVVPTTLAMIVLAQPLIGTIYGTKWSYAPFLLILNVLYNLLALFGWRSFPSLLQAMGDTKTILYLNLLSLIISIPLAYLLVPVYGIVGIIVGVPGSALPSTFIGLYLTWKRYGAKADFRSSGKILLAASLAAIATYLFVANVAASDVVHLSVGIAIYVLVYLVSAPLVGAIKQVDVDSIRSMFSSSAVAKILEIPLWVVEKSLSIFRKQAKEQKPVTLPPQTDAEPKPNSL